MSFNNKPITAKIKRTTKGGMVQQPILNMGGPVKMKASSPAKQTVADPELTKKMTNFRNEMSSQDKTKADNLAAGKAKVAAKNKSNYQKKADQYRNDVSTLSANTKAASKNVNPRGMGAAMNRNARQAGRIKSFENELYNYDTKNKKGSTEGYTAKEYAMAKAGGTYKSRAAKTDTAKNLKARSEGEAGWAADDKARKNKTGIYKPTSGKKVSYDTAYKNRDQKTYGKMDKATYIKEAKRQNASKKAGKGWDVKGKGKNTPPRKKAVASTITPVGIKKVEMSTKLELPPTPTSKPTSKQIRKNASADRKDSRAQRVSVKAEEARASGNTSKADRLDKREARIKKRASKKRGQAAGAIEVKKKTKKQSFNAVTNQSGYDSFKKAGGLSAWSKGEIEIK